MNQLAKHRCDTCNEDFADADKAFEHAAKYTHGITVQAQAFGQELLDAEIAARSKAATPHGERQKIPIGEAAGLGVGTVIGAPVTVVTGTFDPQFGADHARPTPILSADRELSREIARRVAHSGMPTNTIGVVYDLARAAVAWALADTRADRLADLSNVANDEYRAASDTARYGGANATQTTSERCDEALDALSKACHEVKLRETEWKRLAKALVTELER